MMRVSHRGAAGDVTENQFHCTRLYLHRRADNCWNTADAYLLELCLGSWHVMISPVDGTLSGFTDLGLAGKVLRAKWDFISGNMSEETRKPHGPTRDE